MCWSDLEEPNKMDVTPFLSVNLLALRDNDITELKKFEKNTFDIANIVNTASDLKYCGLIKQFLKGQFADPSDDFTRLILSSDIYEGRLTQNVIDRFKPIVKKSVVQYVNDLVNDKIKNALNINDSHIPEEDSSDSQIEDVVDNNNGIVTTEEEIQSYYIVKSILGDTVDLNRVTYKDTISYFSILIDGKVTRWICRVFLKESIKYIIIPNGENNEKHVLNTIEDIYKLSDLIKSRTLELL